MTRKEYFLLKIKPAEVDQKYNIDWEQHSLPAPEPAAFVPVEESTALTTDPVTFTTLVSHLIQEETPASQYTSFLDWSKKERYIEFIQTSLAQQKDYYCFWDSEKISTMPLVCPLSYSNGVFEVEGTFCSFDCCYAYITENTKSNRVLYKDSSHLLHYLYYQLHPEESWKSVKIEPAPSWKLLNKFQGKLSIEQFRKSFQKVLYLDTKLVALPFVGRIYEKVNRF